MAGYNDLEIAKKLLDQQGEINRMKAAVKKARACWPDPFGNWTAEQADAALAMKQQMLSLFDAAPDAPTEETDG